MAKLRITQTRLHDSRGLYYSYLTTKISAKFEVGHPQSWRQKALVACNLSFIVKNEGVIKVTGSHVHFKSGSVSKTVLDRCYNNRPLKEVINIWPI